MVAPPPSAPIEPGASLGHHRLIEKLGEGGMGVVWKALDTTLDREVAIKLLPDALAGDRERLARFEREAKVLATLNHPNIAAIYGFHEAGGRRYLAMELVPGEDLAQRLARGAIEPAEVLSIARDVTSAMEEAHEAGVVHRDLKPANIRLTPDGRVKVLDFGLAKALEGDPRSVDSSLSPTLTTPATRTGVILGTAAYMSPEQARGRPVDRRADIWAFGCVLFEMLAGRRTFSGETVSDTLAAILRAEPEWSALPSLTPAPLRALAARCLEKDPKRRLRDIGEARVLLEDLAAGRSAGGTLAAESEPAIAGAGGARASIG
ncbi:MAG TPA: serine/threonine-protein kinase, partial [Candidatus Saccharimonadales bacterium]|nr:serine/threonine-protein kinase [Candidatus Saccharimonadales bacterium]